jgi:hypothetical protein
MLWVRICVRYTLCAHKQRTHSTSANSFSLSAWDDKHTHTHMPLCVSARVQRPNIKVNETYIK